MRRDVAAAGVLVPVLLLGLLAGCSASDSGASDAAMTMEEGAAAPAPAADLAGSVERAAEDDSAGRQVVTTGEVTMTADEPRVAADEIVALVEGLDGRVDERFEQAATDDRDASAHLVVRVPSDDLTGTLDSLEDIGTVQSVQLSAQDVTAQSQDLDARIRSMTVSVARMEDLLARATTNADLISAEAALAERQTTLETLQSQRARLSEQVALSTLSVQVTEPSAVPAAEPGAPGGFLGGLTVGWQSLVAMLGGLVLVVGVLLPWLVLGAVVTVGVVALTRWVRRMRPARVPDPGPLGPWEAAHAGAAPGQVPPPTPGQAPPAPPVQGD
jgi:hypothetical protein